MAAEATMHFHGKPPYRVAVLHGGPGAAGEMAPVARALARDGLGVLEPWQTAATVDGQVEELAATLRNEAAPPVILIGFSWGAWLGWMVAARHPDLVRKLILVGSGPFEASYAAGTLETRLGRLAPAERAEARALHDRLKEADRSDAELARYGTLLSKADDFDPMPEDTPVSCRAEIFQGVWSEAAELRRSGKLLALGSAIVCPVVAIHGDYDPHPAEGVENPLVRVLRDFRFVLLPKCGHRPWAERQAREEFYTRMEREIRE